MEPRNIQLNCYASIMNKIYIIIFCIILPYRLTQRRMNELCTYKESSHFAKF
jgi:hypothetical protein